MRDPIDSHLRYKYIKFITLDGKEYKSTDHHFFDVPLNKIVSIEVNLKYEKHFLSVANLPSTFVEFVHFRSGGIETKITENGESVSKQIDTWTIGWTDGEKEYLTEYDFKTSNILRSYVIERNNLLHPTHFHPQSVTKLVEN